MSLQPQARLRQVRKTIRQVGKRPVGGKACRACAINGLVSKRFIMIDNDDRIDSRAHARHQRGEQVSDSSIPGSNTSIWLGYNCRPIRSINPCCAWYLRPPSVNKTILQILRIVQRRAREPIENQYAGLSHFVVLGIESCRPAGPAIANSRVSGLTAQVVSSRSRLMSALSRKSWKDYFLYPQSFFIYSGRT